MDSINAIALRGICALYFEHHVSPVLRSAQELQDQLKLQLQELRAEVERKANADSVPTMALFEERLRASDSSGVPTRVRLQELAASLQKKADACDVPTLAHVHKLVTSVEQRWNARDAALGAQVSELSAALRAKADLSELQELARGLEAKSDAFACGAELRRVEELAAAVRTKADAADVPTHGAVRTLCAELLAEAQQRVPAALPPGDGGAAPDGGTPAAKGASAAEPSLEVKRVQVVVAAAGARFDRQLREVRHQLQQLRRDLAAGGAGPTGDLAARWPGRTLGAAAGGDGAASEAGSLVESDAGSAVASVCGSVASCSGLSPEERAELKRIQAVVGAAGTQFSRELRDVRGNVRELRTEVQTLKDRLAARGPAKSA